MTEYKILKTTVRDAEYALNRLAADGWQVVDTTAISGVRITVGTTPLIITLKRDD